jgi:hypothetical protein
VLVRRARESVAHLHFGFPLHQDSERFGITRPWLLGGAWHYAIDLYLSRHWPAIARDLEAHPELRDVVSTAMGPPTIGERSWTDVVRTHVNVALKCLLARRRGVPDGVHRAFASAQGLVLFPWFEQWLADAEARGVETAAHLSTLPDALAADRAGWEPLACAAGAAPAGINLALISRAARGACLVVPDEWTEEAASAAVAGWRLLPLPLLRYSEWTRTRRADARPVIAFGEPERNPLVQRVLAQHDVSLAAYATTDPAIIALSRPGLRDASWCIAVAVTRPESAAAIRMEMALKQTCSYVVFDNGAVVDARRATLDELAPARS